MKDLMIDIETLGTAPGSVILSIGAVAFEAVSGEFGEEFYAAIDPQTAVGAGLTVDVSTLKWWMTQSEDARGAAFAGERPLVEVLNDFSAYVRRIDASRVWAKPPSFDLVLLEATLRICDAAIPWHYRTPRDVRTLLDMSGTTAQTGIGVAHNALDDAKSQAADVINAFHALSQRADQKPYWRCFHCEEMFTSEHAARMHFGETECSEPACQIKAGAEMSMLEALRRAEEETRKALFAMHEEGTDGWTAFRRLEGRTRENAEAAENLGYERGLRDGRNEATDMAHSERAANMEPVAWRVRVKGDDPEEWSLLPAGGGADYLHREGCECQPLYALPQTGERDDG
ncbi:3'-5' exonuclease [Rhizobium sp. Root482]|uniref:3'-5' exonuclease n=1 Tax=Rhizobium sp. Root482 TaxID=1736543 RepID=UPI0006FF056A|nr:3'-5' exonuclease [Rhizobium sp. Root482]KQY27211.1 hypothetical protein ASD31_03240 [Rhizobium sp. Root482]